MITKGVENEQFVLNLMLKMDFGMLFKRANQIFGILISSVIIIRLWRVEWKWLKLDWKPGKWKRKSQLEDTVVQTNILGPKLDLKPFILRYYCTKSAWNCVSYINKHLEEWTKSDITWKKCTWGGHSGPKCTEEPKSTEIWPSSAQNWSLGCYFLELNVLFES